MITRKKRKQVEWGKSKITVWLWVGATHSMEGWKHQACEEAVGIPAVVGGVGKQGIQSTRAVVGGQDVSCWDQKHLVPTASTREEAAGAGNAAAGRLLPATRNKGLVPRFLVRLWISWVGFNFTSTSMVFSKIANLNFSLPAPTPCPLHFFYVRFLHKVHSSLSFLRRYFFSHLEKLSQFSHIKFGVSQATLVFLYSSFTLSSISGLDAFDTCRCWHWENRTVTNSTSFSKFFFRVTSQSLQEQQVHTPKQRIIKSKDWVKKKN